MSTLNFNDVPQYTKDYLSANTLAAVRRFAQTAEGKALKETLEQQNKDKKGGRTDAFRRTDCFGNGN